MSSREIRVAAMKLPAKRRAALAEQLLASLDDEAQAVIDRAWADEAESRIDAVDRGGMTTKPVSRVLERLKRRAKR